MMFLFTLFISAAWALPFHLDIHAVALESSPWTEQTLKPEFEDARQVFSQCGLEISLVGFHKTEGLDKLTKYKNGLPSSLDSIAGATHTIPRPVVYLVNEFADAEPNPFARAPFIDLLEPYPEAINNTVWYPFHVLSEGYKKIRQASPYSPLAHELTHVLTLWGDHNNDPEPNLLTIYKRRNNRLTDEMCKRIVAHPLVRATR